MELVSDYTRRGFTGHEHLEEVGLIHMNGRVYDPTLGRFLSADPIIQVPESTQGLNRYTYVNNNPLSFTDPSGFFFKKIFKGIGDAFGGVKSFAKKALRNPWVQRIGQIVATYYGGPLGAAAFAGAVSYAEGGSTSQIATAAITAYVTTAASGYATEGAGVSCADCGSQGGGSGGFGDYIGFAAVGVAIVSARSNSKATSSSNAALGPIDGPHQTRENILITIHTDVSTGLTLDPFTNGNFRPGPLQRYALATDLDAYHDGILFQAAALGLGARAIAGLGGIGRSFLAGRRILVRPGRNSVTNVMRGAANPTPKILARVVPGNINPKTLGRTDDVFVTDANALRGLNSKQIAKKLAIPLSSSGFEIIEFPSSSVSGIASPINRTNPGFIGGGRTAGGAPEFVIPNGPIPAGSTFRLVP